MEQVVRILSRTKHDELEQVAQKTKHEKGAADEGFNNLPKGICQNEAAPVYSEESIGLSICLMETHSFKATKVPASS